MKRDFTMDEEKEFQQNLKDYLDTLRPSTSKWKGKVTCNDCACNKCMFSPWCDTETSPAMALFNAHKFERMLKKWKTDRFEQMQKDLLKTAVVKANKKLVDKLVNNKATVPDFYKTMAINQKYGNNGRKRG